MRTLHLSKCCNARLSAIGSHEVQCDECKTVNPPIEAFVPLAEADHAVREPAKEFAVCENRECDRYAIAYRLADGHTCEPHRLPEPRKRQQFVKVYRHGRGPISLPHVPNFTELRPEELHRKEDGAKGDLPSYALAMRDTHGNWFLAQISEETLLAALEEARMPNAPVFSLGQFVHVESDRTPFAKGDVLIITSSGTVPLAKLANSPYVGAGVSVLGTELRIATDEEVAAATNRGGNEFGKPGSSGI